MSKFKLITGNDKISTEKRDARIKDLESEITARGYVTDRDNLIYAYHFLSLGLKPKARHHLEKISSIYWNSGIFKDLYRSILAELMLRVEASDHRFEREFEFFIVVKRMIVMLDEVDFTSKFAFIGFKEAFLQYSDFTQDLPDSV